MPNEPLDPIVYVGYFIAGIACIAICYFFLRWIFDIPSHKRHYKAQTQLLASMAAKLGVDQAEIDQIILSINPPSTELPNKLLTQP